MVAQAAPPDSQGNVNLSLHYGATRPELLLAGRDPDRLLVIEVNPNLPRTKSLPPDFDNTIPLELIDVLVEADGTPFALEDQAPDATDTAVAEAGGALCRRRRHAPDRDRSRAEHGRLRPRRRSAW